MKPVDTCSNSACSSMSTGDWYLLLGLVRAETGELTDGCYIRGISQGLYTYVNDSLGEERLMRIDASRYNLQTREWHRFWNKVSDTITVSSTQLSHTMTQSKWHNDRQSVALYGYTHKVSDTIWVTQRHTVSGTMIQREWCKVSGTIWVTQWHTVIDAVRVRV